LVINKEESAHFFGFQKIYEWDGKTVSSVGGTAAAVPTVIIDDKAHDNNNKQGHSVPM